MSLWIFFLVILGAFEAYGKCPQIQGPFPCTCSVISDKFGDDFAILTCSQIQSEDALMQILDSTRGERLFEFQLVDSSLRFIPYKAFLDTSFEVLSLENSSINALSDTDVAFAGLENTLRLLEITNCSFVTNWDWSQLSHLKHLMEIVVMHSDLIDITNGLNTIQNLDVESFVFKDNSIGLLESHVFAPFALLERLALDKNRIEHLERTMFPRPAKSLKILALSYNRLSNLPPDLFVDMPALTSLYLTGNPLSVIDEKVFKPVWSQIRLFFAYDSPLSCDCRLSWLVQSDNSDKYIHAVCNSPGQVRGRPISSIQSHEVWC